MPPPSGAVPSTGAAWKRLLADAQADPGQADVADQDSGHDVATLAAALACVRTAGPELCGKARTGVVSAIGTERGGRWLAVGRNLTAYVIAADVLGLRADGDPASAGSRVEAWIRGFLTERLADNNSGEPIGFIPFASGSNASAQEGAAFAAVAAYLGDRPALQRAWDAFRTYTCDSSGPDREHIDLHHGVEAGWAYDDRQPCAVNPAGATKAIPEGRPGAGQTRPIGGAIINDMARGGDFAWPPGATQYPWTGLEGLVPAAVILERAGYPAFAAGDRAVLRAAEYLWYLQLATRSGAWFHERRSSEIVQLVNVAYGSHFPLDAADRRGTHRSDTPTGRTRPGRTGRGAERAVAAGRPFAQSCLDHGAARSRFARHIVRAATTLAAEEPRVSAHASSRRLAGDYPDLRAIAFALRRGWWAVVLGAVAFAAVAAVAGSRAAVHYEASTGVLVGPPLGDLASVRAAGDRAPTYASLAASRRVVAAARARLGLHESVERLSRP